MSQRNDVSMLGDVAMQELEERVLRTTLAAVRQRRRRQERSRTWATLAILMLLGVAGRAWLVHETGAPELVSKAASGPAPAPTAIELRPVLFCTEDVGTRSAVVFSTSDRPPAVVLINDEQFLDLCAAVGGGLVTLADNRRIAVLGDPALGAGPAAAGQP